MSVSMHIGSSDEDGETQDLLPKLPGEGPHPEGKARYESTGWITGWAAGQQRKASLPRRNRSIGERLARGISVQDAHTEEITLAWHGLDVYCKDGKRGLLSRGKGTQKQILHNVSGFIGPGTLTAIMGASGAGKTTLLNVLNQRNIADLTIEGDIRVNGEKLGRGITAISSFVQQDDLFVGILKVKEHLWFQSMLRMDPGISTPDRELRVESVMEDLGLVKCADAVIGSPGKKKGISGGEMKRLSFASELLTNPALLFCDEPTSGLDSFMAQSVIQTLQEQARGGKTVIFTVHQPSSEVYALFEQVLLMSEGRVAYMGPAAHTTKFFKELGYPCPSNYNPADFIVWTMAIQPHSEEECREKAKAICDAYADTSQFQDMMAEVAKSTEQSDHYMEDIEKVMQRSPYKATWLVQFLVVMWRSWTTTLREPMLLKIRIAQVIILALLLGLIFLDQEYDQAGVMNINGALFLMQIQMSLGNLLAVINTFPLEMPVYLREHHNGMYRCDVYYLSKMFAELLWFIIIPILYCSICYWMIGFQNEGHAFLIAMGTLILVTHISIAFGYMISTMAADVNIAASIAPLVIVPLMLFGGFFLNIESVPVYFIWLQYLSWFSYANEILVINQWEGVMNITCTSGNGTLTSSPDATRCFADGQAVIDSYNFDKDNYIRDFSCMAGLMVLFRVLSFIFLLMRSRRK